MRSLFGTDGIRAKAREFPLDPATMFALGESLAHRLQRELKQGAMLLGMDTRESGPEIAVALSAGIRAGGGRATFIGVVPTPAVAYLCRMSDASAGISISASHNPFEDNGVKIFGHDGMKLADSIEKDIEDELMAIRKEGRTVPSREIEESPDLIAEYERFLTASVAPRCLAGRKIVLDTGHGAAYRIAPEVFRSVGAEVIALHDAPNGRNINEGAGALHPERMAAVVRERRADFGVAFDGDADRAIFVDDAGTVRNGDEILYLWATRLHRAGQLANDTVVATVMSNFGFERQLEADGVRLLRAGVGDKYVLEMMLASGAKLGGEQSGHIIDLTVHTTGDGIHTGLVMGEFLAKEPTPFSKIRTFDPLPQVLLNQKVSSKPPLEELPRFSALFQEAERQLSGRGRILVRYSGTENLVRVMVEADDGAQIQRIAESLISVLREEIG